MKEAKKKKKYKKEKNKSANKNGKVTTIHVFTKHLLLPLFQIWHWIFVQLLS